MGRILGNTGDIYQMLQGSVADNSKIDTKPLSTIPRVETNSGKKKDVVDRVFGQDLNKSKENSLNIVDDGTNKVVSDTATNLNPEYQSNINNILQDTLNIQRLWLGDNYQWSEDEANTLKTLLRLSDDPQNTASRYIASKGFSSLSGLSVKDVYNNLDEISQYYIGDVYDAHDVSFAQKVKNGFIRNDLMSLKYEYMQAERAGNNELGESLEKQIQEKQKQLGDNTSSIPLSAYDEIETMVLENFGYIVQPTAEAGLGSSLITAAGIAASAAFPIASPAILAGTKTLATASAIVASGKKMYEWSAGETYYSLTHDYEGTKDKELAYLLATVEGLGTAAIETLLDGVSSRAIGAVSGKTLSNIGIRSVVDLKKSGIASRAAKGIYEWATGALDEGFLNEAPEYILGEITTAIYKNANGIIDEKTLEERGEELKESIINGIIVGAVYGAVSIPSSLFSQKEMALDLRRTANQSKTMSEFELATKDMKPEDLSNEDFDTARTMIWKASQNQKREYLEKNFSNTVLESEEIASQELFSTTDQETGEETVPLPNGSVYRVSDNNNSLYSEIVTDNKTNTETVYFGNPEDHTIYGAVEISSDGDTQKIESVRVRTGYESIRAEMVKDALVDTLTTETNVAWNPTTKGLISVKEELVNNNPNKTGLVYTSITRGNDSDIQSLKTQIKNASPNITDAEATLAARLTSIADAGTNTIKYEKATEKKTGKPITDFRGATETAKALIYVSENSDPSTFIHELFHAVSAVRENESKSLSNGIRRTLQDETSRSELESFIKNHIDIWGNNANIDKIMASLLSIKENSSANNWTIEQNENLAMLYEAYRSSAKSISQSLPQAIRAILQKLSELMNKVYRTLRDVAPLNENIAKAYDSLMGFDSIQDKERSAERQKEFKEFKEGNKKETSKELKEQRTIENIQEESKTLFQTQDDISNLSAIEQFDAIKKQYYGTDEYMIAPNGKATNLTEEQWIQVRTPNFIKWFGDWINDPDNASKVVDENREPLVVYHTTNADFDTFKVGERAGLSGKGIYFAVGGQGVPSYGSNTIEAFLNIRNPLTRELLKTDKYSSINNNGNSAIQADVFEKYPEFDGVMVRRDEITVKDPNQIKSATENNGEFRTESDSILYQREDQGKLLDRIDNVSDSDIAEELARENEREKEWTEAGTELAEKVFDYDSELPDNWLDIFSSESENRLQEEIELENSLPETELSSYDIDKLETEENESGLIRGVKNYGSTFSEFATGNAPDIFYEGTDVEKDSTFKKAIESENTLRQYLAIMGEAYLYGTSATNREYIDEFNKQRGRWEQVAITEPYKDNAYRQALHDRLFSQLSDRKLSGAMKAALTNEPMSEEVLRKTRKELSSNARFYRNILALLIKQQDMLPETLIKETKGLDIPLREQLDIASISDLADLAKKANNERLRQKILSGTAKFGNDEDQKKYEELVSYTKDLDRKIKEKEKEVATLSQKTEDYEKRVKELEDLNKKRTDILLDADEVINLLSDTFVSENAKKTKYRQELAQKYSDLLYKYNFLSSQKEREYQKEQTQAQRTGTKGKAGWRQEYRGTKYGTKQWVKEVIEEFPELEKSINEASGKNKRMSYENVAKSIIEKEREEVKGQINTIRLEMLDSSMKALIYNSNKIASTLSSIKDLNKVTKEDTSIQKEITDNIDKLDAQQKEIAKLKKDLAKAKDKDEEIRKSFAQKIKDIKATEKSNFKEKLAENKVKFNQKIGALKERYREEINNVKETYRQKQKEKKQYEAIRQEKKKIANAILQPISLKSVDYSKVQPIQAIQSLIDPTFRREWVYDIQSDPSQDSGYEKMSIKQAKDYLATLSDSEKMDLFSYMPQDLVERLTEQKKPLNDWTIAELRQMASAVESLKREGRAILQAKKEVRAEQAKMIKRQILNSVASSEDDTALPSSLRRLGEGKGFKARLHSITFKTRRMQELAQLLDGGYGNKGTAYRLLVEEKRWHQNREAEAIEKRYNTVEPLVNNAVIDKMIDKVNVDLGRGVNADFTVDQLAYAWLSQFDEQNKQAVMYGSLMSEEEKGTVESKSKDLDILTGQAEITVEWLNKRKNLIEDDAVLEAVAKERYDNLIKTAKEEITKRNLWDLVNAINADFNNPLNSKRLDAASIEYFNAPLEKRENYLPIRRMAMTGENLDDATADSLFNLNANKVVRNPSKGFLIERIHISPRHQKQVNMSLLEVWQTSVRQQEHLIEFCGYIKKLRSVFESQKSSEVEREINRRWTPALMKEVKDYIEIVANPDSSSKLDPTNEVFKTIRGRTGAAYLGWKFSGLVLQAITSPMPSFSELKPWEVFSAYAQLGAHPIDTIKSINEKSLMMKNRTMNPIIDEALQRKTKWIQSKASRTLNKFEEVGMVGLTLVDRYAVAGQWLAMYERTLREGDKLGLDTASSEERAIQKADEFILRTQPVGDPTELASLFRTKSEAVKSILQFQTSLNVIYNNLTANLAGFFKQKEYAHVVGSILGYAVAGVILGLVQSGFDDDDDKEDKAKKIAYWSLSQGISSTPVVGSTLDSLSKYLITGDYDWYMSKGVTISPIFDKTIQALLSLSKGDGWSALKKSAEAVGIGIGLPVSGARELFEAIKQKSFTPMLGREE